MIYDKGKLINYFANYNLTPEEIKIEDSVK